MTNTIINDIKSLRGSEVRIFGQPTILASEVDNYTIDIITVLESLKDFEFNSNEFDIDADIKDTEVIIDLLMSEGYILNELAYKCDNSYNWMSPVSNDFDYRIYKNELGGVFVELQVHRFGDVRCNYTDAALYVFNDEYHFYELLSESNKDTIITIEDNDYYINIDIFHDGYEVFDDNGYYIGTIYDTSDDDTIINNIIDLLN